MTKLASQAENSSDHLSPDLIALERLQALLLELERDAERERTAPTMIPDSKGTAA